MLNDRVVRVVWVVVNIGPYHNARFTKLAQMPGIDLCVVEVASNQRLYPWSLPREYSYSKQSLFAEAPVEDISPWRIAGRMVQVVRSNKADVFVMNGYSRAYDLTMALLAQVMSKVSLIVADSTEADRPRPKWKEGLKKRLVSSLYDGSFVSGTRSQHYLESLGLDRSRIQQGYDVVDNLHFSRPCEFQRLLLPSGPFFLTVARFSVEKNLFALLEAYRAYAARCARTRADTWPLVLCGSGPIENELRALASTIEDGTVMFPGFLEYERLPEAYQRCGCFILPSWSEPWGLVVNEAMAAGAPVLVSDRCGCAPDLVQIGRNGFTFRPDAVEELTALMHGISTTDSAQLREMGLCSKEIVSRYTPESWANDFVELVERCMAKS